MDNESTKSPQTGGLKIMTVFIAVLALHVLVIGGFTVYHLMSGSAADADLASDKSHKNGTDTSIAGTSLPDAAADKTAPTTDAASTPAQSAGTDVAAADASTAPTATTPAQAVPTPIVIPTPAPEAPAPAVVSAPAPMATPEPPSTPVPDAAAMAATSPQTPTGPITSSGTAATAPEPAPFAGPVHMPPPSSHAASGEREHGQLYTVKITDSYNKIAHAHHVTVAQLKLANHISGNTLHTGQRLLIPTSKMALADAGTTALDAENESRLQPTTTAYSTSTTAAEGTSHHHLYTVQRGDTLKKIARKFNTSPAAILGVNSISNPAKLTIGKKLRIPSAEARSARVTTPAPAPEPRVAQPAAPSQVETAPTHMDGESAAASGELANFAP